MKQIAVILLLLSSLSLFGCIGMESSATSRCKAPPTQGKKASAVAMDKIFAKDGKFLNREMSTFGDESHESYVVYDLSSTKIIRKYQSPVMCEILGFLDNYTRQMAINDKSDFVEHFYPSETEKAEKFYGLLKEFVEESQVQIQIQRIIRKEEGGDDVTFRSKEMAKIINSFYKKEDKAAPYTLDRSIFNNPYPKYKLAFLRGAYTRYGQSGRNMFHLSSGGKDLIIDLLLDLHCMNIRYIQEVDMVPSATTIIFRPTNAVKKDLGITKLVNIFIKDTGSNDRDLANTPSVWTFRKSKK